MKESIKPFIIMGALDSEIEEYLKHVRITNRNESPGFIFHEGYLENRPVVIVKSGVGKVFAAMTTQKLIEIYNPVSLVFTGIAGALNKDFEIGDIVVAHDCMQHDIDVTALGFPIGMIPYTNHRIFKTDIALKKSALSAKLEKKIHQGRVLTGDQFIASNDKDKYNHLRNKLKGDVVEMEGASVGQVCIVNEIPFLIIRTISDKADHSATVDFSKFLPDASKSSFEMVQHILANTFKL